MRKVYIGADFHATRTVVQRIECGEGKKTVRSTCTYYTDQLATDFTKTLDTDTYVCVEASTAVFAFCDIIRPYVKEVVVVHPNAFRRMYLSGKKTDRIDARQLANRLKAHIEDNDSDDDFPAVWIPPAAVRELRELFSCLNLIKKTIGMERNKLRALLRSHLIVLKDTSDIAVADIHDLGLPESTQWEFELIREQLNNALASKEKIEERIKKVAVTHYGDLIELFTTIHGLSILGAAAVVSDGGSIERFKTAKHFASYMRSAPRVDSSNETTHIGHIDKAGRKTAFMYIIEGLVNIYGGNKNFGNYYATKTKGKSKCKVRAALVRKVFITLFYMWKNRKPYRFYHEHSTRRKMIEIEMIRKKSSQAA